MKNICFIGCGNMGEAFLKNFLEAEVFTPEAISFFVRSPDRRRVLAEKYGVVSLDVVESAQEADIVFLAVKPQNLGELPSFFCEGKIVISILAGTKVESIKAKFKGAKVVRAMPNLGQFEGAGMTGVFLGDSFSEMEKGLIRDLFSAGAEVLEVSSESDMDKITAVSGSGPAYFFWFCEQFTLATENLGFSKEESARLSRQTFIGAAEILKQNPEISVQEFRERVTSKGGTTEAALEIFKNSHMGEIVANSVESAKNRSEELSKWTN